MYLQIKIHNSISPSAIPNNIRLPHHIVGIAIRIIIANNKNTVAAIGIITPKILRFNLYTSNNEYVFISITILPQSISTNRNKVMVAAAFLYFLFVYFVV